MKTAVAAGSKAAGLDFKKSWLEVFAVNQNAAVNFVAYPITHDSHDRSPIAMLALQAGYGTPAKAGFGFWDWGTLWRECGFGK